MEEEKNDSPPESRDSYHYYSIFTSTLKNYQRVSREGASRTEEQEKDKCRFQ